MRDAHALYKSCVSATKAQKKQVTKAPANPNPTKKGGKKGASDGMDDFDAVLAESNASQQGFQLPELMRFCDQLLQTAARDAAPLFKVRSQ